MRLHKPAQSYTAASAHAFVRRSLTGSAGACTTRLATVVVDVDDPGGGRDRLGDLVGVARGGNAGPDVEELADPRLPREVTDGTAKERPVGPHGERHPGVDLEPLLGGLPVGREVVLAVEQVVVHPGLVRPARVEGQRP